MYKGFSIITNFGCDLNCCYCIWKNHPLKDCRDSMDWARLNRALGFFPQTKISISGGGDPLYNLESNGKWYENLFYLCRKNYKKIDIHTAQIDRDKKFLKKFNKYVLHLDYERFEKEKDNLVDFPIPLRLVFVFTQSMNLKIAEELVYFATENNYQLSFRELVLHKKGGCCGSVTWSKHMYRAFDYIYEEVFNNNIRYIEQSDYNIYYMPDNKMYTDFMTVHGPIC